MSTSVHHEHTINIIFKLLYYIDEQHPYNMSHSLHTCGMFVRMNAYEELSIDEMARSDATNWRHLSLLCLHVFHT